MRTNIEISDDLLLQAQKYSRARTKRALVEEALTTYITVKEEQLRSRTYKERLESIRNRIKKAPVRSDAREIIRKDRDSR